MRNQCSAHEFLLINPVSLCFLGHISHCFLSARGSQSCDHCVRSSLQLTASCSELSVCLNICVVCAHALSLSPSIPRSPSVSFSSLSSPSRFFHLLSFSSLTSSCVIQLRNISSSRLAINIACPPKTVRIIIFLVITAVFL